MCHWHIGVHGKAVHARILKHILIPRYHATTYNRTTRPKNVSAEIVTIKQSSAKPPQFTTAGHVANPHYFIQTRGLSSGVCVKKSVRTVVDRSLCAALLDLDCVKNEKQKLKSHV